MSNIVDLDASRAARDEALNKPKVIRFKGEEFELPARLPVAAIIAVGKNDMEAMVGALFRDRVDEFLALEPDDLDIQAISRVYGTDLPESRASGSSSKKSGGRSRRISSDSTESTSPEPASAPTT